MYRPMRFAISLQKKKKENTPNRNDKIYILKSFCKLPAIFIKMHNVKFGSYIYKLIWENVFQTGNI